TNVVGNENGIWLQDSARNFVVPVALGMYSLFDMFGKTADGSGTSTGNQVGIRVSAGADRNVITGRPADAFSCPLLQRGAPLGVAERPFVVNNDVGILIEGGSGNQVCGIYFGAALYALA